MPAQPESPETLLKERGCSAGVIAHCRAVTACAMDISAGCPFIDKDLVKKGALLHDIGRCITHSIAHAQEGADLCRRLGIEEPVAKIVERHTGAGLTADECTLLGLLPRDCMPMTAEERLVAHADNLTAGTRRTTIYETLGSAVHLPKKIRRRMYRLALDIEILCR